MNQLVKDWICFCNNEKDFDKSHFSYLFKSDLSDYELEQICSVFDNHVELKKRIDSVFNSGELGLYLLPSIKVEKEKIIKLLKNELFEKSEICKKLNDDNLSDFIDSIKITYSENKNDVYEMSREISICDSIFDLIGDYMDSFIISDKRICALEEACYNLSNNYYLSWYIIQPILNIDFDFVSYFNFWKAGGIYTINGKKAIVSSLT